MDRGSPSPERTRLRYDRPLASLGAKCRTRDQTTRHQHWLRCQPQYRAWHFARTATETRRFIRARRAVSRPLRRGLRYWAFGGQAAGGDAQRKITASSAGPHRGSRFEVSLPLINGPAAETEPASIPRTPGSERHYAWSRNLDYMDVSVRGKKASKFNRILGCAIAEAQCNIR